ncbi:hypothetical protein SteCoe_29621 [Stentor coeruleus]|uniref:VWFA domain-containing protein n=1 Tax=Stentor coeruleus TaxID=5963 RepID=A0A1R2B5K2_9CILI|nr:hypothetical protein SteCoe_29621 [Stentor coeruleus]
MNSIDEQRIKINSSINSKKSDSFIVSPTKKKKSVQSKTHKYKIFLPIKTSRATKITNETDRNLLLTTNNTSNSVRTSSVNSYEAYSPQKQKLKKKTHNNSIKLNNDEKLANNLSTIPQVKESIISFSIKPLYTKVIVNKEIKVPCIITLKSDNIDLDFIEKNRLMQDLIFVIDVSGSMMGNKLDLVKLTIKFILTLLNHHDKVSIISFSDKATILCPLIAMTNEGKSIVIKILKSLNADSGTNIESGVYAALNTLANRNTNIQVANIFLLTDGRDNFHDDLKKKIKNLILLFTPKINQNFKIHTFGYGNAHDSETLVLIAELTKGNFYYIENESEICILFAKCLGEIASLLAYDIKLSMSINKCNAPFSFSLMDSDQSGGFIAMPNLLYGDKKNIVFILNFTPVDESFEGKTIVPVEAQCSFTMINGQNITKTAQLMINFASKGEEIQKNKDVLVEYYRVDGAMCLKSVLALSDEGKFDEATQLIGLSVAKISSSEVAEEPLIKELLLDLRKSEKSANSNLSWQSGGRAYVNSTERSHSRKVSNRTHSYDNRTQRLYSQRFSADYKSCDISEVTKPQSNQFELFEILKNDYHEIKKQDKKVGFTTKEEKVKKKQSYNKYRLGSF